ncbi:MAG: acyl-CoA reductase [Lachnospiraceae bacterium]|nr:acyl-CoA reductase [Lachnospiraceae bacterium]
MALKTEELLRQAPYEFGDNEKNNGQFYESLLEELAFHYDCNELYRRFCDNKNFNPHEFAGGLGEIPPVQVSVFKELGQKLASVPKSDIKLTLQSSATSGVPSSIPVDKLTSKRQAKAMVKVVGDFIGNERKPFLVMDVNPEEGFRQMLGARFAAVSGYLNFASQVGYFLKVNDKNQYYFDIEGIRKYISELDQNQPTVVFGFTYILYSEVILPLYEHDEHFQLPRGSKVIHIGGWKKLESEKISKAEFNEKAARLFGLEPEDIIDIYGFTEQMGLNYPDCKCGCKHAPLYSEVIVRDISTKEIQKPGEEGLLEFLSPIPHSYPGNVVLTDDVGMIVEGECPYGRSGTRFKINGRLKKAEIRGCGDILSSKLKFTGETLSGGEMKTGSDYRVEFFSGSNSLPDNPIESLQQIIADIKQKHEWLVAQPIDALIGLVAKVAAKWNQTELRMNGLGFLATWCTPEHLNELMNEGLYGNRMHMDAFLPCSDLSVKKRKAVSRGLACHWLAGNVQVLGMFVLIESILTKNVNLIKVSSRDNGIFCELLSAFKGESFTTLGGYTITGDELLNTIAVVYYGHHEDKLGRLMSEKADIRIAWGGKDAVTTVSNYPAKYDCEDLIMGPKLSFSVIAKEAIMDEHKVKKLARRVAVDASVFDQTGCASTHNVFVERGGAVTPEQFAEYLNLGMEKVNRQITKGPMSAEQISAIHSARGIYDFKGKVWGDPDSLWTVLYSDDVELNAPVYSRVIHVHPVDDIEETLQFINGDIQTIGMAAEGEKELAYAVKASEKGAVRFPVCGKMLNFDSPWDGMYLTSRMVKWVTLGGPSV